MPARITMRRLFRNYTSLIGAVLAGISFTVNVFLTSSSAEGAKCWSRPNWT